MVWGELVNLEDKLLEDNNAKLFYICMGSEHLELTEYWPTTLRNPGQQGEMYQDHWDQMLLTFEISKIQWHPRFDFH